MTFFVNEESVRWAGGGRYRPPPLCRGASLTASEPFVLLHAETRGPVTPRPFGPCGRSHSSLEAPHASQEILGSQVDSGPGREHVPPRPGGDDERTRTPAFLKLRRWREGPADGTLRGRTHSACRTATGTSSFRAPGLAGADSPCAAPGALPASRPAQAPAGQL